ncbi:ornithine carbamoyltransferase [Paenibacillus sambharensis]|uniref:Ornithine carbamoyltransferase n=1 Tax=Paenibacillus sambharensis TaxID=1803190 RepID=A0A2W1LF50_9BACL|nr:ornithine carbamoyltransferase [Paenibacillus sambharensis]PZD97706.1 ornithine carbamoyltransferase [Paenibacillus sambharensis]
MHLLNISELSQDRITELFHLTDKLKHKKLKEKILEGRTFILFFPESSIRTRTTFEKGINDLGGECILFPPESLDKKEELSDVMKYLNNWADGVIIRHSDFDKMNELSQHALVPIINAMSSQGHPCEILSDLYSIREIRPDFSNLTYTFVGPRGNIVTSWAEISKVLNLKFQHVCAAGNRIYDDNENYHYSTELEAILSRSDVVLTDSLPTDYQTDEYLLKYQINLDRMRLTKQGAVLNPCPPFFRGQEVSEDVIDSDYFVGHGFKKNLLYVQQAIILQCLGLGESEPA